MAERVLAFQEKLPHGGIYVVHYVPTPRRHAGELKHSSKHS
jgi:hypothetical protein